MKKALVFLVLLAMLLPSGWMVPHGKAASQGKIASANNTGVQPAAKEGQTVAFPGPLSPADMDPISTCQAPLGGPFGNNAEIFMGGDIGHRVDLVPAWKEGTNTPVPTAISNISAVAASSENIVAVWKDGANQVWFDLWQTSGTNPDGAWLGSVDLGFQADGDPTIIARSEYQWEVYARKGSNLYTTILTDTLSANRTTTAAWVKIKGVDNAASDPTVISVNPNFTAIFYLDAAGHVWFTEWTGGWEWRNTPLPLVDNWWIYLPLATKPGSGSLSYSGVSTAPSSGSGVQTTSQNFQFLNAVARNDNHIAVFAVNADRQLWVREWTKNSADDWSNTHWVKLMDGVALEKPGVASRHSNHIGVAVRDTLGNPYYIEWTIEAGWSSPTPLPGLNNSTSGLTLAALSNQAYQLFGVDISGNIQAITWVEDNGWGEWETVGSGLAPGQIVAAPVRHFMDVIVVGYAIGGAVKNFHFSSQGGEETSTVVVPQGSSPYPPRGQALGWVDGSEVYIGGRQSDLGPPYFWQVDAREMVDSTPLTGTLPLLNHDFWNDNVISMATGDLDFDGNDEAVIATTAADSYGGYNDTTLSVLDFSLGSSVVISQVVSTHIITDFLDISVNIGDLDGNGRQDEIAIFGVSKNLGLVSVVYRYNPETHQIGEIYQSVFFPGNSFGKEVETAIGRLYPRDPNNADPRQQYLGEQLIVLYTSQSNYSISSSIQTFTMITGTWELSAVDSFQLGNSSCSGCMNNRYRSAVDAGDVNGDGYDEIAAWYGMTISMIEPRSRQIISEDYDPSHDPLNGESLAVGDIDLDGRAEILAGSQQYLSIYEIMGDGQLVRTKWQQWDPSWGTATAVLAGDLDHDTFASKLVGCKTFKEARVAVVINGAPRYYDNGVPIQDSSGSFSISQGGNSSAETGTSQSWGNTLEIGYEYSEHIPFVGDFGFRASVIKDYLTTVGQTTRRDTETIYGTNYLFDDTSLGQIILDVRTYTCNYYDLFPPDQPQSTSRAMVCNPVQHDKEFHSLDWWLTSGDQGDFEYSWADVGHKSPGGVHTNSLEESHNYASSLPVGYRVLYNWAGSEVPLICGDPHPHSVEWWAENAQGYAEGIKVSTDENTSISAGWTIAGVTMDVTSSYGNGTSTSETYGWTHKVGFSGGVTQFYYDPTNLSNPGYNLPCYKVVPYVYQARAQTLGGFTYPYLELDYYVP